MALGPAFNHTRTVAARDRADAWLEAFARNRGKVGQTDDECNVPVNTRQYWQRNMEGFAQRKRMILAQFVDKRFVEHPGIWSEGFETFRKMFFGRDTQPQQARLVEVLETVKPRDVVLVLMFPESGKTATLEDWLCRKVALDPDVRITYLGESTDHAKRVLGFIKSRMTEPEPEWLRYQERFGPFYVQGQEDDNKPWTQNYITVNKASHAERDRTIQCRAIVSRAYGSRVDILIGDDIQSRQTYTQTDKIFEHLRQTYFTRGKRMTTVIVGNRIGPGDIYERMIDEFGEEPWFHLVQLVAAHGDVPDAPEAWADRAEYATDEEHLEAAKSRLSQIRRQVGEEVWWSSYQQSPRTSQLASFSDEVIERAKDYRRPIGRARPGSLVYLTLDPALGGMNALFALGFTRETLTILDLQTDTGFSQTEQILNRIREFAALYRPARVIVEKNSFQRGLVNDFRLARLGTELGFTVQPHETGKEKNDPILGVAAMAGSFNAGHIRIPWADPYAITRLTPLISQLEAWRPNVPTRLIKQDTVMALWFGWKHWRAWQDTFRQEAEQTLWRPTWMREDAAARR